MDARTRSIANVASAASALVELLSGSPTLVSTPGEPLRVRPTRFVGRRHDYGATIVLDTPLGAMELGLFGTSAHVAMLATAGYGHDPGAHPQPNELADALAETSNVLMGRIKQLLIDFCELEYPLGLPCRYDSTTCRNYGSESLTTRAVTISSSKFELTVVWTERSAAALIAEVRSLVADQRAIDAACLARSLALLEEARTACLENPIALAQLEHAIDFVVGVLGDEHIDGTLVRDRVEHLTADLYDSCVALLRSRGIATVDPPMPELSDAGQVVDPRPRDVRTTIPEQSLHADCREQLEESLRDIESLLIRVKAKRRTPTAARNLLDAFRKFETASRILEASQAVKLSHAARVVMTRVVDGELELDDSLVRAMFITTSQLHELSTALDDAIFMGGQTGVIEGCEQQVHRLHELMRRGKRTRATSLSESSGPSRTPGDDPTLTIRSSTAQRIEQLVQEMSSLERWVRKIRDHSTELGYIGNSIADMQHTLDAIHQEMTMVSAQRLLHRVAASARAAALRHQKMVRVSTAGERMLAPAELLQQLADPLDELVRNAVQHGIESPEARRETDKRPLASLQIHFEDDLDGLRVSVCDDGRGLDIESIEQSARERGLPRPPTGRPSDWIFEPGLSTASAAGAEAGAGAGLSRARDIVHGLGGKLEVETTRGSGCSFHLQLPIRKTTLRDRSHAEPDPLPSLIVL